MAQQQATMTPNGRMRISLSSEEKRNQLAALLVADGFTVRKVAVAKKNAGERRKTYTYYVEFWVDDYHEETEAIE